MRGRQGEGGIEISLLGPVAVRSGADVKVPPSLAQRRLLAMLAVEAGRPCSSGVLQDRMGVGPGAVRTSVTRLRRMLPEGAIRTGPDGYVLTIAVDSDRFAQILAARHGPDQRRRLRAMQDALALVRGTPLAGVRDEPWALGCAVAFDEMVAHAQDELADAHIRLGQWSDAIAVLSRQIQVDPLRDRTHGLLMQAFAGAGRQAEALAVYQDYHRHLREELGTEPSREVQAVQHRIATSFADAEPAGAPPSATADTGHLVTVEADFLPRYRTRLVGRDAIAPAAQAHMAEHQVVTLTGPGGVGKTRLATHIASAVHQRGGRVWYVALAPLSRPQDVGPAIARVVGAPGPATVVPTLAARRGLLVIDNGEHLLDAVADAVDSIADGCPGVSVLLTSREATGVDGEKVVAVPPLELANEAPQLFLDRAADAGAALGPTDRDTVRDICRQLDGLPLAIEIAATRAATLGVKALQNYLDDRLHLTDTPRRPSDRRHRSLDAAIEWSYRHLDSDLRAAFRLLSVFPDGFETDAARAVLTAAAGLAPGQVVRMLAELSARSMISPDGVGPESRWRLLEPLRDFASERRERAGESASAAAAHAAWLSSWTASPSRDMFAWSTHVAAVRLEREVGSWRAAVMHAAATDDAVLAGELLGLPGGWFLLGRPDLTGHAEELQPQLVDGHAGHQALAMGRFGMALATKDLEGIEAALAAMDRVDPADRGGATRMLRAAALILLGDAVEECLALRRAVVDDASVPSGMRDHQLVNGIYGVGALHRPDLVPEGWPERARVIARDSDLPSTRRLAHLCLASIAASPQEMSRHLDAAARETGPEPLLLRRIWTASIHRLRIRVDPVGAADGLLALVEEQIRGGYPDDHTVLVTCAALLATADHPRADDVIATVVERSSAENLARSIPDVGCRARKGKALDPDELPVLLVSSLRDVAAAGSAERGGQLIRMHRRAAST